jgi:hypothetical protein
MTAFDGKESKMKVKVTGTRGPDCWYDKHRGKIFDVEPYYHFGLNTGDYEAKDPDYDGIAIIAYEDCEAVSGSEHG